MADRHLPAVLDDAGDVPARLAEGAVLVRHGHVLRILDQRVAADGDKSKFLSVGDWYLNIKNQSVKIWGNGIAVFYLEGTTNNLELNFSDGDTRFEGENFKAEHINVRQVSSNDVIVYPVQSLKGSIHSTGDVISYNKPPIVEVTVLNNYGNLIFK